MNIIFFGSSKYSTIVEEKLYQAFGLTAVVTIPNKEAGRGKSLVESPVKTFAAANSIPCITTNKLDKKIIERISSYKPDFLVVADYGLFLPHELLKLPKYAPLNVHHSLLPKYRGPSPAPTAILNGDKVSGVSIIKMTNQVDAGDILAQKKYTLKTDETTDSLLTKLNEIGGEIITSVINDYTAGNAESISQDKSKVTFTKHIQKQDGYIDLTNPPSAEIIDRMIRAYYPWPGVWTRVVLRSHLNEGATLVKFLPENKIQVEGKKPVSLQDFANGYPNAKEIFNLKF